MSSPSIEALSATTRLLDASPAARTAQGAAALPWLLEAAPADLHGPARASGAVTRLVDPAGAQAESAGALSAATVAVPAAGESAAGAAAPAAQQPPGSIAAAVAEAVAERAEPGGFDQAAPPSDAAAATAPWPGEGDAAYAGSTATAAVAASGTQNIDGLLAGVRWLSTTVTYSHTDQFANDYEDELGYPAVHAGSFEALNAAQQLALDQTAAQFSAVSGLNLVELSGASDRDATIRAAESNDPGTAYAYYPSTAYTGGDIWFNKVNYNSPSIGTYAFYTFLHEMGHALGLKHGQETGGPANVPLTADRDSGEFSVMTYRSYIGHNLTALPFTTNQTDSFTQTLMMLDIQALQYLYGADFTTQSTDSVYTFSLSTGEMFINGAGQGTPSGNRIYRTVWDGNGTDTYDLSNYTTRLAIDLSPGGWSDFDLGGNFQRAQLNAGYGGIFAYSRGHVFNALQYAGDARSLIENAVGGSADDSLLGNATANRLEGRLGHDTLAGAAGNDTLDGGEGNDVLMGGLGDDSMLGGLGDDRYFVESALDVVTEASGAGLDEVNSSMAATTLAKFVENLTLTGAGAQAGKGNGLANRITGQAGDNLLEGVAGADTLIGGQGNDTLNGGTGIDSMVGGLGNDNYRVDSTADVVVEAFGEGTDTVESNVAIYELTSDVENLINRLDTGVQTGRGNTLDNTLTGNLADDNLLGLDGNDTITGGAGNDTLTGGNGNDVLGGDAGNDSLAGGAGDDSLTGAAGNDTLNGAAGNDTLRGGLDHDDYLAVGATDVIIEFGNQGFDRVFATGSYTLGNNLEYLELTSGATGTGNGLDNTLVGNAANNTLGGLAGADTLRGREGNDSLLAGADAVADQFVFDTALNAASNVDTLFEAVFPDDQVLLDNDIFGALLSTLATSTGTLGAAYYQEGVGLNGNGAGDAIGVFYNLTSGGLYYNPTAGVGGDSILFAIVSGATSTLDRIDFTLVD